MANKGWREDFRVFLFLVWQFLKLPPPTPAQYALAKRLQYGARRDIICAFRGVGKSWITTAFVVWKLAVNRQLNVEVVSASKNLANNFSTFAFRLIYEFALIQDMIPERGARDSRIEFDVGGAKASKDPSVKSVGIFGQITGTRADLIVADDVETPKTAQTVGSREKLSEAVKEFDAILKPDGEIKYLGTPQTQETLYKKLARDRGYSEWIWPSRFPTLKQWDAMEHILADELCQMVEDYRIKEGCSDEAARSHFEGQPTDPKRFTNVDLIERETSYGKRGFQLQFQLDPSLADAARHPLRLADLVVMHIDDELAPEKIVYASNPELAYTALPLFGFNDDRFYRPMTLVGEHLAYTDSIISVDPAGRGDDETAVCSLKFLNSYIFMPELRGLQGGYDEETLKEIKHMAYRQKAAKILVESNFGDGMFVALLKPVLNKTTYTKDGKEVPPYPVTVEEVRATVQKEKRIIDTLEPVMARHRLVIDPRVIHYDHDSIQHYTTERMNLYSLFHQLTHITAESGCLGQDDRLDCLAQGVAYFVDKMSLDEDKMKEMRREAALEEELRRFKETQIVGGGYLTNRKTGRNSVTPIVWGS